MSKPTADRVRELLDYCPESGLFTWKIRTSNAIKVGDVAGSLHVRGYVHITIDGKDYKAHRLAHLVMTGEWPPEQVDHINLVRSDNRWINLRLANNSQNNMNRVLQRNNTSGVRGVKFDKSKGKWTASVNLLGVRYNLGSFDKLEDAVAMRRGCEPWLFGEFHRSTVIVNFGECHVER